MLLLLLVPTLAVAATCSVTGRPVNPAPGELTDATDDATLQATLAAVGSVPGAWRAADGVDDQRVAKALRAIQAQDPITMVTSYLPVDVRGPDGGPLTSGPHLVDTHLPGVGPGRTWQHVEELQEGGRVPVSGARARWHGEVDLGFGASTRLLGVGTTPPTDGPGSTDVIPTAGLGVGGGRGPWQVAVDVSLAPGVVDEGGRDYAYRTVTAGARASAELWLGPTAIRPDLGMALWLADTVRPIPSAGLAVGPVAAPVAFRAGVGWAPWLDRPTASLTLIGRVRWWGAR